MANVPAMCAATTAATLGMRNVWINKDGQLVERQFKFGPEDIGKFLVLKFRYQENMFWGALLGTKLQINDHILSTRNMDSVYGVYEICWHNELCKSENNVSYKVHLKPVGDWGAWCPNRSWYSSDVESMISQYYNLIYEIPLFDTMEEAHDFAIKKNNELYPKKRTRFDKIKEFIFNIGHINGHSKMFERFFN